MRSRNSICTTEVIKTDVSRNGEKNSSGKRMVFKNSLYYSKPKR